jgi:YD repeat-containing protein
LPSERADVAGFRAEEPVTSGGLAFEEPAVTGGRGTFVYNNAGLLTSATNPENGTVTYTYGSDNTLQRKHDARGQDTVYDLCGRVFYTWGTDPTSYSYGRLASIQSSPAGYGTLDGACGFAYLMDSSYYGYGQYSNQYYEYYNALNYIYYGPITDQYYEFYIYDQPGQVTVKAFSVVRHSPDTTWSSGNLQANYTYDTGGRLATVTYPMTFTDSSGSQPVLTMAYDTMGRPSTLTDSSNTHWVSSAQYDFAGRIDEPELFDGERLRIADCGVGNKKLQRQHRATGIAHMERRGCFGLGSICLFGYAEQRTDYTGFGHGLR